MNNEAVITINQASVDNNYIRLTDCMSMFPADIIGGRHKGLAAKRKAKLKLYGVGDVMSDIDGEKSFFRSRGAISKFFKINFLKNGDRVVLVKHTPYEYELKPIRNRESA